MQIEIANCNNIRSGIVKIEPKCLNIKYGINGTGKSTVAKAIDRAIADRKNGTNTLLELSTFGTGDDESSQPCVKRIDAIEAVHVFNEDYVDEFIFQSDELIKGSFDIFIRDKSYDYGIREIEKLVANTKALLQNDKDIEVLLTDFEELSSSIRLTRNGIHGGSKIVKTFKEGNKVVHVPQELNIYKPYIQSDNNFKWIKWQLEGQQFMDITDGCPYCVNDISAEREAIEKVGDTYKAKDIENLNKLVAVFDRLKQYFSEETRKVLDAFIYNVDGYTDEQSNYLVAVKGRMDELRGKFEKAKNIGFSSLKDAGEVTTGLQEYLITIDFYREFDAPATRQKIALINDAINQLIGQASQLQQQVDRQKEKVDELIKRNKWAINSFLRNAGYKYEVDLVEGENAERRLVLRPLTLNDEVKNVKSCLSHGERNAFALVLFMFDALSQKADLIVLDDPISSFDNNKKYAMMEMLFGKITDSAEVGGRKHKNFRGETVLLLSHDFEPVVDIVRHHCDRFPKVNANFLNNSGGLLKEQAITKDDIQTFIEINNENIADGDVVVSQLVYLRRNYEITKAAGMGYQLVSNIFHKRDEPVLYERDTETTRAMTSDEIEAGVGEIQKVIAIFNYAEVMQTISDAAAMTQLYKQADNNYEKLHLYRMIFDDRDNEGAQPSAIEKFINQAFHIETDYMYQLNPARYQTVPQYVIDECDRLIEALQVNG